jgi:molybdopterin/thiamine biosynthesis adenylyltransferase
VVINQTARIYVDIEEEDRYSRLRLIPWWDQELLKKTKVLVVGAGALGNEILKNLALVGIGNILVLDMDQVENSNLSRSVLFRSKDEGKSKAEAAANMIKEINPDCNVQWLVTNAVYDLGLGVYRWADIVIGGLDNREARLAINQSCWKVGTPWIDGAIEVLFGMARVFIPPDSPCYECTMNEMDYKLLNLRRSCALLTRKEMAQGKVPTTPTIASIIAGVQVQEALKIVHNREDMPALVGKGLFFNGLNYDSYVVEYSRKEMCQSHEHYDNIQELDVSVNEATLGDVLDMIRMELGKAAVLELEKELVTAVRCEKCNNEIKIFKALGKVTEEEANCEKCNEIRSPEMTHTIDGSEPYIGLTLAEVGIPGMDLIIGRNNTTISYYELTGDRKEILGELSERY